MGAGQAHSTAGELGLSEGAHGDGGAAAGWAPQSSWPGDRCQRGPAAGLGGAPGMTVVRRVLARAGAWQGARLGACSGSGAGRRAPRGAGKGQICETGWAFPGRPRKPRWVVGLCPKAAGGR